MNLKKGGPIMSAITIIISVWVILLFVFILFFCLAKINEMNVYKNALLSKINTLPEEALKRELVLSEAVFRLREIKKNPALLDYLNWEDIENINFDKTLKPRQNSPDRKFLRKVYDLPAEALQRKVCLFSAEYSLNLIKKEWRTLFKLFEVEEWEKIWNNPGLTQIRISPR